MDFGYSSSASSSPDQQSYLISSIYDTTPDSSVPTSPGELQQLLALNPIPLYNMVQYQNNPNSFYAGEADKIPIEMANSSTSDDPDRRTKKSGKSGKDKVEIPNMHLRRRAQNRASQRAFRERRERHLKGIEHQLESLNEEHRDLLASYTRQSDEVAKLHERIQELTSELERLRSSNEASFGDMLIPDKFDSIPKSDMVYTGPGFYFNRGVLDMASNMSQSDDRL